MKSISRVTSFTFATLLGVVFFISILNISYILYRKVKKSDVERSLAQICSYVSEKIFELYESTKNRGLLPKENESILLGEVQLNLPQTIFGGAYEVILISPSEIWIEQKGASGVEEASSPKVVVRSGEISVECSLINLEAGLQGRSHGGGKLSYYRYNFNGTIKDKVVLNDEKILVDVKVVS